MSLIPVPIGISPAAFPHYRTSSRIMEELAYRHSQGGRFFRFREHSSLGRADDTSNLAIGAYRGCHRPGRRQKRNRLGRKRNIGHGRLLNDERDIDGSQRLQVLRWLLQRKELEVVELQRGSTVLEVRFHCPIAG